MKADEERPGASGGLKEAWSAALAVLGGAAVGTALAVMWVQSMRHSAPVTARPGDRKVWSSMATLKAAKP